MPDLEPITTEYRIEVSVRAGRPYLPAGHSRWIDSDAATVAARAYYEYGPNGVQYWRVIDDKQNVVATGP